MKIVLGISGSIAAYKSADLASQLVKLGHEVHVVMTRAATEFITPLTLQTLTRQPVLVSLEDEKQSWKPGHIELADRADLFLVAPASANTLGNFANGLAPDPLTSIYLALPRTTPVLLAPAMNGKMWLHPATERNVARLLEDGCHFIGPAVGDLACGYEGIGRLAAVEEIPALLKLGVVSFKIEGRLKTPEYVAAVCQVYRKAIDAALADVPNTPDRQQLEMAFSRGLSSGWMHGVNHQELVSARFGKKRGPLAGRIVSVGRDCVELTPQIALKLGDGVVFDTGGDTNAEQGGRIFGIKGGRYFFQHGHIDFARLKPGDRVWKTDDPELNKRLRQSFAGKIEPRRRVVVDVRVNGRAGEALLLLGSARVPRAGEGVPPARTSADVATGSGVPTTPDADGSSSRRDAATNTRDACAPQNLRSALLLQAAHTAPLTTEKLREHLGRFGESGYVLGEFANDLEGDVILPIGELNRLRRELVFQLDAARAVVRAESPESWREVFQSSASLRLVNPPTREPEACATLRVLCRTMDQLDAALSCGIGEIYADFEDLRRYKDAVARVRLAENGARIFLATPRIQKAGEQGFFKLIENAAPDGVLIRNLGAIAHFAASPLRKVGDFSLNVANPLTAQHLIGAGLERVTVSYDLNIGQVLDLLAAAPPEWFELTIHQHMPMFHMEHCVFAAFLSKGKDATDCGRPCEKHRVSLRDRVGVEHPLRADVGCRNTLFNAVPQTGARFFAQLGDAGLRDYRVELLEESADEAARVIRAYQTLLGGERDGEELWRELRAQSQLGVTHGTYQTA